MKIALVGDFDPGVLAQQAIPQALALAAAELSLELARNALGFEQAGNVEDNPDTGMPLISALSCRLADEADAILFSPGSRVAEIYQRDRVSEEYNCGFGVNRDYLDIFDQTELEFCGYDAAAEPRIFKIRPYRFFCWHRFPAGALCSEDDSASVNQGLPEKCRLTA